MSGTVFLLRRPVALVVALFSAGLAAGQALPVFLADNHAGTFGWIARTFDPDTAHHLVLIDAHSDTSAAENSEEIRERLRRVPSLAERAARVENWRAGGRLQAFNWIEPLMPRPLDRVLWVAAPELHGDKSRELTQEAVSLLDGRLEVEPRSSGSFAGRWRTLGLTELKAWNPGARPVILSIDLDFLTGMPVETRGRIFDDIWRTAMDWPGLAGVSIAVSRPWLADDAEADALVLLACSAAARTRGAVMEIDATPDDRPDHSKQASRSGGQVPRWDAARASPALRAIWHLMGESLTIRGRKRGWTWPPDGETSVIEPDDAEADCDGVWRFPVGNAPVLRIRPPRDGTGRVRWFALEPARDAYDFLPHTGLGKDFSESPGRWIYEVRSSLGVTGDYALAPDRWSPGSAGRIRLEAEVETAAGGWLPVPPVELRLTHGSGFHAALSECFRMPYGFGIAGVSENDLVAVETGWASDCANLLVHAWRRNGLALDWGDPGRLRTQLETLVETTTTNGLAPIPAEAVGRGIAIDFGRHVAALWEDRGPVGVLDGGDLVMHHLGGFPEIVTLDELAESRPLFAVRTPRAAGPGFSVRVAGDVVLAGDERVVIPGFEKSGASLFLANLEGVPSSRAPSRPPRHDFRFPASRLPWLRERGIDAVSLANNHAGDAGAEGLMEGLAAVRAAGIGTFGAGADDGRACEPWRVRVEGAAVAVFGVSLVDSLIAGPGRPGVAHLPTHAELLDRRLRQSRQAGETVIVLVHGGEEYRGAVNDDQRHWARWLVRRGARLIAGAHPHVIQRTESHGGAVIAHSLGNAVYPRALKGSDSGHVRTWHIGDGGGIRTD